MTKSEYIFYKKILEDLNEEGYANNEKLRMDLLIEFSIRTTVDELKQIQTELLEQPTLENEVEDLEMMYKNVC